MFQHCHLLRALWEITIPKRRKTHQEPDIERLLVQAQQEIERHYAQNREQTVVAITQKNNVLQLASNLTYQRNRCEDIAIEAEDRKDDYIATRYRYRQAVYQEAIDSVQEIVEETVHAGVAMHTQLTMEEIEMESRIMRLRVMKEEWQIIGATAEMERQIQAEARSLIDESCNHYSLKAARDIVVVLLFLSIFLLIAVIIVALH